jgi:hypothetical protein
MPDIKIKILKKNDAIPSAWYNSRVGETISAIKKIRSPVKGFLVQYEDDKAIVPAEFAQEIPPLKSRPKKQTRRRKVSDLQIIRAYEQGLNQLEMAKKFDVTPQAISLRCKKLGIKTKKPKRGKKRVKKVYLLDPISIKRVNFIAAGLGIRKGEAVDMAIKQLANHVKKQMHNKTKE